MTHEEIVEEMKRVAKEELSALVEKDWEYKLRDTGVLELEKEV